MIETVVMIFVGIVLIVMGYLIGIKGKISLIHFYHYKRVAEEDKPILCKKVGLGNLMIGAAILLVPLLKGLVGETIALTIAGVTAVVAVIIVIAAIIKYNHGLF